MRRARRARTRTAPFASWPTPRARALLGWLGDDEAKHFLVGHTPLPSDDPVALQAKIDQARAAVIARPVYEGQSALVPLQDSRIDAAQARLDLKAEFWGLNWTVGFVDLREVLTFQKVISTEGLETRVASVGDSAALFELCLPTVRPKYPTTSFKEQDGKTFTISSLNPNLRIAGAEAQELHVSPEERGERVSLGLRSGA